MKKSLVTAFIIIAFIAIAVFSVFSVFVIKDVTPTFTVSKNCSSQTEDIKNKLNSYKGQSLLFLDLNEVKASISENPYLEVVLLEKSYPNVLKAEVKERIECYKVVYGSDYFVIDGTGFVLAKNFSFTETLPTLVVTLESTPKVNEYLSVSQTELELYSVALTTVYNESYTNNVEEIRIVKELEKNDLVLSTSTGVIIEIWQANQRGSDKLTLGFNTYDEMLTDRDKYTHRVCVFEKDGGTLSVTHTAHGE